MSYACHMINMASGWMVLGIRTMIWRKYVRDHNVLCGSNLRDYRLRSRHYTWGKQMNEHEINLQYERTLEDEWERYNEEGDENYEYDRFEEAEAIWEMQNER